ncbi:hypothetical protein GIB67_018243 [Kingdonia uniflora]|uniref:FRIGIDA-like protein n=1 Tax=Kingdonia uniflora TaxID=39325 RepID=A0A7J7N9S0_9MAGN|nr:hypothetical protein GIB67_012121 [Kingdonia uniflora]KAF6176415.1 hypothetical protein GIB67_018243 [Kingdonia uniflora]
MANTCSSSSLSLVTVKQEEQQQEEQVVKSVNDLRLLSSSISQFLTQFTDLQNHLNFIDNAIHTRSKYLHHQQPSSSHNNTPLVFLCETMGSRGLRKHIVSNLDVSKLRQQLPDAIKRSPNPRKLVFDCIGGFYLQGKKAYLNKASPMVTNRKAVLLIMECFLLSGCNTNSSTSSTEDDISETATKIAVAWRKRLISEGGIAAADTEDAQGLLLFIACFGIPSEFANRDILDLFRLSNAADDALRSSPILLQKFPDIIQEMVKSRMYLLAVVATCTFGLQDKFPPRVNLKLLLSESGGDWKRKKHELQGSPVALREAHKKQLATLKSVVKCLEDHKIDQVKLADFSLSDKISKLEKDISDLDKKIEEKVVSKRKADAVQPAKNSKTQEVKRPRPVITGVSTETHSSMGMLSHEPRTNGLADSNGFPGLLNGYPGGAFGAAISGASGSRFLPGTFHAINGGLIGDRVAHLTNSVGSSYPWYGERVGAADNNALGHSYMGLQPPAFMGRGLYGATPSSLERGFLGNRSSASSLYQFADTVGENESYYASSSHSNNPAAFGSFM